MKLNIGCGARPIDGWVNLDLYDYPGVNFKHDLSKGTLPFDSGSADYILASHVLEHLDNWEPIVIEAYRVLAPGGVLEIHVPHELEGFKSPYHKRIFMMETMDFYFTNDNVFNGLQPAVVFEKLSQKVNRWKWRPFGIWHLNHYLGINIPLWLPGRKWEIVWKLRKPGIIEEER
jgi:SAM-dependent methyltransferase